MTIYAGSTTAPSGGVWLPGPAGTPGHLWISDAALGFCRVDPALTNCNTTAGTPGQPAFDPATSSVYLPDSAPASLGVYRLHFNQTTEAIDSATELRPTDGLGGNRPTSAALDPVAGALYIGFARTPNIVRITNPSVGVGDPKEVIGNSQDGKQTAALGFVGVSGSVRLIELDTRGVGQIFNPASCNNNCTATALALGITGPLSLAVQNNATVFVGDANSVSRYDSLSAISTANPITYASGFAFVSGVASDPSGNLFALDDPSRGATPGSGHVWKIAQAVAAATVPGAPTAVSASAGNAQASVSWTAPLADGGSAITSYTVTSSPAGASATVAAPALSATLTGLTNGTAVTFTVTATNAVGSSAASAASNSVTPVAAATVPGAPTAVSATAGNAQASVTWTAPLSNGGSAISSYTVSVATANGGAPITPITATVAAPATSATLTGLSNGTAYTFTVTATNAAGTGAASAASNSVTPITVPGAPSAVSASAGNAQASVNWTAPLSNGGSAITSYTVSVATANGGAPVTPITATVAAPATSATLTGLTNGTAYTFTVTATNAAGTGAASAASNSVTPITVPGAPTAVSATAGNAQASVSWTAPLSNGGSAISSYTVSVATANGGAPVTPITATVAAPATSATLTGLSNGTAYTFTVTATNAAGRGAASAASNSVTPITVPGAPTAVSATATSAQATVTWTAPASDGFSPITSYTINSSPAGANATVAAPATTVTLNGLTNGIAYTFTVIASNAAGSGAASVASNSVTPSGPPAPLITANPPNPTGNPNVTFGFTSATTTATFACSLVQLGAVDAFTPCTSPKSYGPLADGTYTFKLTATDPASGQTSSPAVYEFSVRTVTAPTATAPVGLPSPGAHASTAAVPVTISWSATSCTTGVAGCNIVSYHLQRSINGLPYADIALPSATATSIVDNLTPSPTNQSTVTTYTYKVQATNAQGQVSAFAIAPTFSVPATDNNGAVSYSGSWSSTALTGAYGGSVHFSNVAGSFATLPSGFTGSAAALVSTLGPDRGIAQITLDGVVVATVDLYSPTLRTGQVVWSINGLSAASTHTFKVTVLSSHNLASSGSRVDFDAFIALK